MVRKDVRVRRIPGSERIPETKVRLLINNESLMAVDTILQQIN